MLKVSNINKSIAFYEKALGFQIASKQEAIEEWRWAIIQTGRVEFMLSESDTLPGCLNEVDVKGQPNWPTIYYFYPEDLDELHNYLLKRGFHPSDIEKTSYGMREFSMQDPDGHYLCFGQDSADIRL